MVDAKLKEFFFHTNSFKKCVFFYRCPVSCLPGPLHVVLLPVELDEDVAVQDVEAGQGQEDEGEAQGDGGVGDLVSNAVNTVTVLQYRNLREEFEEKEGGRREKRKSERELGSGKHNQDLLSCAKIYFLQKYGTNKIITD